MAIRLRSRLRAGSSLYTTAALSLDFLSGTLDPRITFTRATTATFVGSNGLIQTAAINGPRFDYDPVTLAAKGLLIEEQRTNLLLRSEEFDNAAWSKLRATISANSTTAPDGTSAADTLVDTAVAGTHVAIQVITKAASAIAYAASVYVKQSSLSKGELRMSDQAGNGLRATFDLAAGTVGALASFGTGFTIGASSITPAGNGWYRVTITGTSNTATSLGHEVYLADASGNTSYTGTGAGLFVYGAQLEAGSFATSYIPTVASQVTRSADVATMTGANFSNWYNQNEGTFAVNADTYHVASSKVFYAASDGGANNEHMGFVAADASVQLQTVVGGVTQSSLSVMTATANTPFRVSYAYKANNFAGCGNGGSVQTDASGTLPVVDRLSIGLRGNNTLYVNGHIRSIAYYNTRLRNDELQVITG